MIAASPAEASGFQDLCSGCGIDLTRFNRATPPDSRIQLCKGCDAELADLDLSASVWERIP